MKKSKIFLSIISLSVIIGIAANAATYRVSPKKPMQTTTPQVYNTGTYTQNSVIRNNPTSVVELVMDYSGSMASWVGLCQSTMSQVIYQMPKTTKVGLRVFGHTRTKQLKKQASVYVVGQKKSTFGDAFKNVFSGTNSYCTISDQLYPISPLNTGGLISAMNNAKTGGSTPLTYALKQTIDIDFLPYSFAQKKKIVLITDGGENCGGNACNYIKTLAYRKDIVIDVIIVGNNAFRCLADATGGSYYRVDNQEQFSKALEVSMGTQTASDYQKVSPSTKTQAPAKVQKQSSGEIFYEYVE